MLTYQKYLIKRFLLYFYVIFSISILLVWLFQANSILALIISKGISLVNFVAFSALALPEIISFLLPIAIFISLILSYQSFYQSREIYSLRNCGLSDFALMKPALFFAIFIALLQLVFEFFIIPAAHNAKERKISNLEGRFSNVPIEEKVFIHPTSKITIYCNKKDKHNILKEIFVNDNSSDKVRIIMYAKSGQFIYSQDKNFLVLYDGVREEISENNHQITEFIKLYFDISIKPSAKSNIDKKNKNLNVFSLVKSIMKNKDIGKLVDLYNRIFFPILNILLAIISSSVMLKNYQLNQYYSFNIKVYLINFFILGYFTLLTKIYYPSLMKIIVSFASFIILTCIFLYHSVYNIRK